MKTTKIKDVVKNILGIDRNTSSGRADDLPDALTDLPEASPDQLADTASNLIGKAVNGPQSSVAGFQQSDNTDTTDTTDNTETKTSCPYATKRAIVKSLQEIRAFAEEHKLASTVVKALLTLLAEIALDALKGKVTGRILETLLKAINFDKARREAYKEGEIAGKNKTIETQLFAESSPSDIPDIHGSIPRKQNKASIFDIAKMNS